MKPSDARLMERVRSAPFSREPGQRFDGRHDPTPCPWTMERTGTLAARRKWVSDASGDSPTWIRFMDSPLILGQRGVLLQSIGASLLPSEELPGQGQEIDRDL